MWYLLIQILSFAKEPDQSANKQVAWKWRRKLKVLWISLVTPACVGYVFVFKKNLSNKYVFARTRSFYRFAPSRWGHVYLISCSVTLFCSRSSPETRLRRNRRGLLQQRRWFPTTQCWQKDNIDDHPSVSRKLWTLQWSVHYFVCYLRYSLVAIFCI